MIFQDNLLQFFIVSVYSFLYSWSGISEDEKVFLSLAENEAAEMCLHCDFSVFSYEASLKMLLEASVPE